MHDVCNIMYCGADAWNAVFSRWLCTRELVCLKKQKHFNVQSSSAATFVSVPLTSVWEGLGLQCMCGNGIRCFSLAGTPRTFNLPGCHIFVMFLHFR